MNNKTKVAAYCRVSTNMEDQLNSLSAQIKYFTEYISEHEDWELVEVYYDEGITGTSVKKRDGFNRMIKDCEKGKINTILTKEVSRFARNTVDTLNYTRQLSQLGVNIIFMNDGIDTSDKDGELRLTIMASIAQEESRKISERVKWGIRRKMESGYVYGYSAMLGYRTEKGKLTIVPEEAEIVKRIFHSYVSEHKGCHTIANELNAAGMLSVQGKMWREDGVCRILKNDKYVGDLTQWKHYSTDFLTKQVLQNNGDNPDVPLITIPDHHEGIISREVWNLAQKQIYERGKLSREGRKYSSHYWFSSKVVCGKCGYSYNVSGRQDKEKRCMHCVNRAKYGSVHRVDANGAEVGCDNVTFNEVTLRKCMKYLIEHIQVAREDIVTQLLADIQMVQQCEPKADTEPLKAEIENLSRKKRKAIDMMLEELLSREDLKKQVDYYDGEIARLTQEIADKQDINAVHQRQFDSIKEYIKQVNLTAEHDSDDTEFYSQLLKKAVVIDRNHSEFYLNCVPFGFRMSYSIHIYNRGHQYDVSIEKCETIL
ncbi:recombinase family protein [Ruminococcus sp.]|uniref:recombinase family protein n=1 Tax=Ruminococcus sp. TaxID=41978 RepID=UPI001B58F137|nr:recombinase family protein [Ruminococcus sp.]MBP5433471.1 recombinase family protein [Ruminococcus sp.]